MKAKSADPPPSPPATQPAHGATPAVRQRLASPLLAGFILQLALMVALIVHAVWHIEGIEARVRDIVEVRNLKIRLATDLQEAAYNRHNALVYQALAEDPFERDANFQLFIRWGYEVGKARNELRALPLDAFEQANLQEQDRLIGKIAQLHEEIADLAARDDLLAAQARLTGELRPLNLALTQVIENLRRHERDQIHAALKDAGMATHQAVRLHWILGGALLVLAAVVALLSLRQIARHTRTIVSQMEALQAAGRRLQHEATHDPLTGLANRALFRRRLEEALQHAREEGFSLAVMYVDLDDFKPVNDRLGHAAGDELLRTIAQRLRGAVRVSDTVARLGGDEFALVLTGLDMRDKCPRICEQIEHGVQEPVALAGTTVTPSCSVGHALYPVDGGDIDALLAVADARMYAAKRARKDARGEQ